MVSNQTCFLFCLKNHTVPGRQRVYHQKYAADEVIIVLNATRMDKINDAWKDGGRDLVTEPGIVQWSAATALQKRESLPITRKTARGKKKLITKNVGEFKNIFGFI